MPLLYLVNMIKKIHSKDELRQMIKDNSLPAKLQETFEEAKEAVNWNIDILKAKNKLRKGTLST